MTLESLWPLAFDGAIFDFDGTLGDSADVWNIVDKSFFAEHKIKWVPETANHLASMGFVDASAWVVDEFGLSETPEAVREEWMDGAIDQYRTSVDLHPGAREYLSALKEAGVPMALATTNARAVLEAMEPRIVLSDFFDHVLCGEDVERNKNYPDVYLEAARRLGVDPGRCIVFEDIPQAIRSAHAAGMTVVGVMSGDVTQAVDEVRAEADFVLESWRQIKLG